MTKLCINAWLYIVRIATQYAWGEVVVWEKIYDESGLKQYHSTDMWDASILGLTLLLIL